MKRGILRSSELIPWDLGAVCYSSEPNLTKTLFESLLEKSFNHFTYIPMSTFPHLKHIHTEISYLCCVDPGQVPDWSFYWSYCIHRLGEARLPWLTFGAKKSQGAVTPWMVCLLEKSIGIQTVKYPTFSGQEVEAESGHGCLERSLVQL